MSWKNSYNFFGSSRPFLYRDNFSGLSNESMGTAPNIFEPMDPSVHQLIFTVNTYQRLLQRYATYIVKNKLVASLIIEETFTAYTEQVKIIPPNAIRNFLKTYTLEHCRQWLDAKDKTLTLRKPKNPT